MFSARFGGRRGAAVQLEFSPAHLVVRSRDRASVAREQTYARTPLSKKARAVLDEYELAFELPDAGVQVLRPRKPARSSALRDRARKLLKKEGSLQFAGRVLVDRKGKAPVLYTENLFVKFADDASPQACLDLIKSHKLEVKREARFARNAWFLGAPEGIGTDVFGVAERLLENDAVELCHPELVRQARSRAAFAAQWHLKAVTIAGQAVDAHANVEQAWALSQGEGITIAVIDGGIDIDHEEFRSQGKIVAPRDVSRGVADPRPAAGEQHGTACAGVACADGNFGASGVAPRARLMPIRLRSGLGSMAEADAFDWAARNGADVISCSWGPADGDFANPSDPLHYQRVALPDSTRLAIESAIRSGRGGKGCVIFFAAGNGNESVDNDGYASYPKVIAVAACNDRGKKAPYSDYGNAVWCSFPSNNVYPSLTPGIWTTDRTGKEGYNAGDARRGDAAGNYTNSFGGTSSACPGAAGVAALVLARNRNLGWDQVRDLLRRSCDRIDTSGGRYGAEGRSPYYGYGRLNARRAVELAAPVVQPPAPAPVVQPQAPAPVVHPPAPIPASPSFQPPAGSIVTATAKRNVAMRDLKTARVTLLVDEKRPLADVRVSIVIEHSDVGDLTVLLDPPNTSGVKPIMLHNRGSAGAQNLTRTYDRASVPGLAALQGKSPAGKWMLVVTDDKEGNTGHIRNMTLEMRV